MVSSAMQDLMVIVTAWSGACLRAVSGSSWYGRTGTCFLGLESRWTRVQWGFGVQVWYGSGVRVPTGGSHVRSLWGLILTLAYITKRLSEEETERDLVGGRTALLIYPEGQACSPPTLSFFRLLLAGSAFFLNLGRPSSASAVFRHLLPLPTAYCRLPPPPTTFCRLPPPPTAFRHLPSLSAASRARGP